MLERLALLLACAALLSAAVLVLRAWASMRRRQLEREAPARVWDHLELQPDGRATLVAFSTQSCAACHTAQAPALQLVEREVGPAHVRLVSVDAARQPAIAQAFGILTVPSTVVLGADGQVLAINHGFAPSDKLTAQLQAA